MLDFLEAILRKDFMSFLQKVFYILNPKSNFHMNWHIEIMSQYLQDLNQKRLIINIPPRCLKSICISVAWPAWLLGNNPSLKIIVVSYSQALSIKHSLDCKFIIESHWYQELFPDLVLVKKSKEKFITNKYGFRLATSVGGSITGEGADIIIIDDPHNPTHIYSDKMRQKVIDWYNQTLASRLNDRKNGIIILVMQRLHINDLSGYLIKKNWHLLKLPIILDRDIEEFNVKKGEILHKEIFNDQVINDIKQDLGHKNFAAQYMQNPINITKGMLQYNEIEFYEDINHTFEYVAQSWDTAVQIHDKADFSVCSSWGVYKDSYYLIDVFHKRLPYPQLKSSILSLANKWNAKYVLIEDKSSGQSLIQDLKGDKIHIIPQKPKIDKITRFASTLTLFNNNNVKMPKNHSWSPLVINQLTNFPYVEHDDIVDSITQFLIYIKVNKQCNQNFSIRDL